MKASHSGGSSLVFPRLSATQRNGFCLKETMNSSKREPPLSIHSKSANDSFVVTPRLL